MLLKFLWTQFHDKTLQFCQKECFGVQVFQYDNDNDDGNYNDDDDSKDDDGDNEVSLFVSSLQRMFCMRSVALVIDSVEGRYRRVSPRKI